MLDRTLINVNNYLPRHKYNPVRNMIALLTLTSALAAQPPQSPASSTEPVLKNGKDVVTFQDYPQDALSRNQVGIVSTMLVIAIDGRVKSCVVTETSNSESLDKQTCLLMKSRARFDPATKNGMKVEGIYRTASTWGLDDNQPSTLIVMPMQAPRLPPDYQNPLSARLIFDSTGKIAECTIQKSSGSTVVDSAACSYASQRFIFSSLKSKNVGVAPAAVRYLQATLATEGK